MSALSPSINSSYAPGRPVVIACVALLATVGTLPSTDPVCTSQRRSGIGIRVFRRRILTMDKQVQRSGLAESRAIPIFLLTTLLISSVFYFLIIKSGHMGAAGARMSPD